MNQPKTTTMNTAAAVTATMNASTTARIDRATEAYWKSVKLCVARTDGSAEIHHHSGRIEHIGKDGRPLHIGSGHPTPNGETAKLRPLPAIRPAATDRALKCASVALALGIALSSGVGTAQHAEVNAAPAGLVTAIIDDQTGEELALKHGIKALALEDLTVLIKGVLDGDQPASLIHLAVDDDASDNPIGRLTFAPYAGAKPPRAPSPTLPLRVLSAETAKYKRARTDWQRGISAYRQEVVENANGFIHQVAATQLQVAQRFDDMLTERNGRDFNRSDIVGCITTANRLLGKGGRRVLILNTDAKDLPAKRKPRLVPLTAEELDPTVELIFVNTSHLPQQEPLFRGLPNKVHEAASMKSALAIVADMLEKTGKQLTPADGTR